MRRVQSKTIRRNRFTFIRFADIQNSDNQVLVRMWRVQIDSHFEKEFVLSGKLKYRNLKPSGYTSAYILDERNFYTCIPG